MPRILRRLLARLSPILQSDTAFIESAYREILGRPADHDGLNHYRRLLGEGLGRTAVLLSLMRSPEFTRRLAPAAPDRVNLRAQYPARYRQTVDRSNGDAIVVFDVRSPADFDWLETAILEHAYYEHAGVWNLGIDTDKRVVAEMVAGFAPRRALELGCAAGAVLACLAEAGIDADGVEISDMAIAEAPQTVRPRIHRGDLLALDLPGPYDFIFGLDVFEHLNPNRIDRYLRRLADLTEPGGALFCNIPAFGHDDMFGTVFPFYIDGWERDAEAARPFTTLQVDDRGFPVHGHLAWADAPWWVGQFEAAGLRRERGIERALHAKYDAYMTKRSPARRAYFVFGKELSPERRAATIRRISAERSAVLGTS